MRQDALNTVRYAEFSLPSSHRGSNQSIHIGKSLVPFLKTYMPHLQTLHLWKPDDFPWTSSKNISDSHSILKPFHLFRTLSNAYQLYSLGVSNIKRTSAHSIRQSTYTYELTMLLAVFTMLFKI